MVVIVGVGGVRPLGDLGEHWVLHVVPQDHVHVRLLAGRTGRSPGSRYKRELS